MADVFLVGVGIVIGILLGWSYSSQKYRIELVQTQERLKASEEAFRKAEESLKDSFKSLAGDALKGSNEQFLELANTKFEGLAKGAKADLEERKQAIDKMIEPISQSLAKLNEENTKMDKKRALAYQDLETHILQLRESTDQLHKSNLKLNTALQGNTQQRGYWGEMALRNLAEFAGMIPHCDFNEQEVLEAGRPDMIVNIPGGGIIPVDSKVPLTAYMDALDEAEPKRRTELMKKHSKDLKGHVRELVRRDYSDQVEGNIDFTILFIPADPILSAAFEHDPNLQQEAFDKKILICTPVTLVALLRTVGIYWQQQSLSENAELIWAQSKELYKRVVTFSEKFQRVGSGLGTAITAYNEAVGSYDGRLIPCGRDLEKLKVVERGGKTLATPTEIDKVPRELKNLADAIDGQN